MNKLGFIGAIGDDFPSLIPLFFAIMLFFSSLAYAFTTINERDAYINTYINSLNIAKASLGSGVYSSYDDFNKAVSQIITTSNYIVGITYIDSKDVYSDNADYLSRLQNIVPDTFVCKTDNGIVLSNNDPSVAIDNSSNVKEDIICDSDSKYYYRASRVAKELLSQDGINIQDISKYNQIFTYVYPIALGTPKGNINAFLIILVW